MLRKLKERLTRHPWVPHDKPMHVVAGFLCYVVGGTWAAAFGVPTPELWGLATGCMAGVGKEVADVAAGQGPVDTNDSWAMAVGAFIGFGLTTFMH